MLTLVGASVAGTWTPAPAVAATAPVPAGGVAADVNGDHIPLGDLNRIVASIKASDPGLQTDSPTAQKALSDIKGQMLDQLITTRLLAQEAHRQKIAPSPKAVDDALTQLRGNFKTEAEFNQWLQSDGKTVADVKRSIADELAIRELSAQLTGDITVSPDDIGTFYRDHLKQFAVPETIQARHIMLALNPNASAADKAAVSKRAQNLIAQLRNHADFAALAKANSDDPEGRDNGGDMGTFVLDEMIQPIADACAKAKAGDIVGPVTTEFGLHIIRIDARNAATTVPLSTVQSSPQIKAIVLKQKVQARLDERIAKLRAAATIKKYV